MSEGIFRAKPKHALTKVKLISYYDNRRELRLAARLRSFATFMLIFMVVQVITTTLPQVFSGKAFAAGSTYYVDATGGDDANAGTAIGTAWKTIAKVNAATLTPGDTVLLKRGQVWRERLKVTSSGTTNSYITFGAYGTGNKPELMGSIAWNTAGEWTTAGGNIWTTVGLTSESDWSSYKDIANIIFDSGASVGTKKVNHADGVLVGDTDLTTQGDFYFDGTGQVRIYSTQNPTILFGSIELVPNTNGVAFRNEDYLNFNNLSVKNFGIMGFDAEGNSNVVIENNDVSWIGGAIQHGALVSGVDDRIRLGNGIQLWASGDNMFIRNNRVWQVYDAALTAQYQDTTDPVTPAALNNIYFYNNAVSKSEYGIEFWERPAATTASGIYFENNTIVESGKGWAHNQRPDGVNGRAYLQYTSTAILANGYLRNNILGDATESNLQLTNLDYVSPGVMAIDYNHYYNDPVRTLSPYPIFARTVDGADVSRQAVYVNTANGFTAWKEAESRAKDANSILAAASYADSSGALAYNDPGIDAGLSSANANNFRTTDIIGNPIYGLPDMGAFEYQPPYTQDGANIDTSGGRIYEDGKFRDLGTASTKIGLKVTPTGGTFSSFAAGAPRPQWLDVTGITWLKSGDYHKQWTEGSTKVGLTGTAHTVGDLQAGTTYAVTVAGNLLGNYVADSRGEIAFTYSGNYSTARTFSVTAVPEYSVTFNSAGGSAVNSQNVLSGGHVTAPTAPTKTGFAFVDWVITGTSTIWNFATGVVTAPFTLLARWLDNVAPVITSGSVATSGLTSFGATVTWSTDEASDSQVEYGTTTSYGSTTTLDSTMATSHSQALTGLLPDTTYHYRVRSKDATGNLVVSTDGTFATINEITTTNTSHTDGGATVDFGTVLPTNIGSGFNLAITSAATSARTLPTGKSLVKTYDITPSTTLTGAYVATITLDYPSGTTYKEGDTVQYWDGTSWSTVGITVTGHTASTITFTTTHFSEFAVFTGTTSGNVALAAVSGAARTLPVTGESALPIFINLFITACLYVLWKKYGLILKKTS
jgi:hypothetical protein